MKSAREEAHALLRAAKHACQQSRFGNRKHSALCDTATAAIEARDKEHAAELDKSTEERDRYEEFIGDLAADFGCEREWTNQHSHLTCLREAIPAPAVAPGPGDGPRTMAELLLDCPTCERKAGSPCVTVTDGDARLTPHEQRVRMTGRAAAPPVAPAETPPRPDAVTQERARCSAWAMALRCGEIDDVRALLSAIQSGEEYSKEER